MAPSVDVVSPAPPIVSAKQASTHPFAPLSSAEINAAAGLIRQQWPADTDLHFKTLTLQEPPKAEVIPLIEAESNGETFAAPARKAFVTYYIRKTDKFHEAIANLTDGKVEHNVRLGPNVHGSLDGEEIVSMEQSMLTHPAVQAELAKLKLPEGTALVVDPWIYGADGVEDDDRMAQGFVYMRDPANPSLEDSNHYAHPLPISPVFNFNTRELVRVDYLPTGAGYEAQPPKPYKPRPASEYIPESQQLRTDIKPLHVIQPEGASFTVKEEGTSALLHWQKWSFRVGFNQREGMVLYNVRYANRPLFYRLSLSDMNIPYADPRSPYHRKSAFDLGDAGAGLMANNLKLGCDCLGSIYYLSATLADDHGNPVEMPNVICIHEQDAGISWKHTNYRTGRAVVARNRELVLQSIITVANYEYILSFNFNQAAELHYEVRATGILSTQPVDDDVEVPWGTVVHPGVLATHHQHIFSLRIDPMLDGHMNTLTSTEALPLPRDPAKNPHGNGYYTPTTTLHTSGPYDTSPATNRTFKITNPSVKNPINGHPVGYKLVLPPMQPILSSCDSFNHRRAEFADHALYAIAYRDDELYAGGKYTNQSRGGAGVRSWAARDENIENADLVLFAQFGINHVPRAEDFPVMPAEVLRVGLKPVDFFERNPAIDVPAASQAFNHSELISERHKQPGVDGILGGGGEGDVVGCCGTNDTNGTYVSNGVNGH